MQRLSLLCMVLSFTPFNGMDNAMENAGSLSAMEESRSKLLRSESRPLSNSEPSGSHLSDAQIAMEMPSSHSKKRNKRSSGGGPSRVKKLRATIYKLRSKLRKAKAQVATMTEEQKVSGLMEEQAQKCVANKEGTNELGAECPIPPSEPNVTGNICPTPDYGAGVTIPEEGRCPCNTPCACAMTWKCFDDHLKNPALDDESRAACEMAIAGRGTDQDVQCCSRILLHCIVYQPDCVRKLVASNYLKFTPQNNGEEILSIDRQENEDPQSLLEGSALVGEHSYADESMKSAVERRAASKANGSSYEDLMDEAVTRKCR